ncbi:MAG: methylmalonyl-CoA epimerase [Chloroflexi bacterium]|nr:methylmalonyl-CoA epimerase [Chloroflexota bacterium]
MIKKIDHIGIAVKSIEAALPAYTQGLGLVVRHVQDVPDQQVRIAFLPAGETDIELVEPTSETSGVARFLENRGEGIHHLCLEVDDIAAALAQLAAQGMALIDKKPRQGAEGLIAFVHPKALHGVLIELVQKP